MNRLLAILALVASLGMAEASDRAESSSGPVSLGDIILLTERGVSEATILVFLQNRSIGFVPDADDIDRLLRAGVSEDVIRYLIQQTAPAPAYTKAPRFYVDPYPGYYYTPYYTRTSLYFGYSVFPHLSYGHYRHIPVHHYRPHYSSSLLIGHNGHGAAGVSHRYSSGISHDSRSSGGHTYSGGINHVVRSAGHVSSRGNSHAGRSAGHISSRGISHAGRSAGHSLAGRTAHQRSAGHGGRSVGGHRGGGGHSGGGGHGGGGHGGSH